MPDAILFFGIVFAGLAGWFFCHREQKPRFRQKQILTGSEAELFESLRAALPDCVVAPRVAVSSLIEPTGALAARRAGRRRLAGQRVDFAVFDEGMHLLAVIEVVHRSRRSREEAEREQFFSTAGVAVIRLRAGRLPSDLKIRAAVFGKSRRSHPAAEALAYTPVRTPWRNTVNAHI